MVSVRPTRMTSTIWLHLKCKRTCKLWSSECSMGLVQFRTVRSCCVPTEMVMVGIWMGIVGGGRVPNWPFTLAANVLGQCSVALSSWPKAGVFLIPNSYSYSILINPRRLLKQTTVPGPIGMIRRLSGEHWEEVMGCASSTPMVATAGSEMLKAASHVKQKGEAVVEGVWVGESVCVTNPGWPLVAFGQQMTFKSVLSKGNSKRPAFVYLIFRAYT